MAKETEAKDNGKKVRVRTDISPGEVSFTFIFRPKVVVNEQAFRDLYQMVVDGLLKVTGVSDTAKLATWAKKHFGLSFRRKKEGPKNIPS